MKPFLLVAALLTSACAAVQPRRAVNPGYPLPYLCDHSAHGGSLVVYEVLKGDTEPMAFPRTWKCGSGGWQEVKEETRP